MNSAEEESDPVEGYDSESGNWVIANKTKRNKKDKGRHKPKTNEQGIEGINICEEGETGIDCVQRWQESVQPAGFRNGLHFM